MFIMRIKELSFIFVLFLALSLVFFYKAIFHGLLPFPGDLLISNYSPWDTYSYIGHSPGGYPSKDQYFDVLRQMYPWNDFATTMLKNGQLPLWNPYNFSGAPLLANFQSGVFYFPHIFYLFIPLRYAWSFLVFIQVFLSGFFTYIFARKIGIKKIAAVFSGITFGFSLYQTVWLEYNTVLHAVLWLPLILFCSEKIIESSSVKWKLIFVLSIILTIFAGHPQVALFIIGFSVLYIFYRVAIKEKSRVRKRYLIVFSFLIFCSLGIAAIQLLPGLELTSLAARGAHDFSFFTDKLLIQPWQLIMFFAPDFFGNPATKTYWIQDTYVGKAIFVGIAAMPLIITSLKNFMENNLIKFFSISAFFIIFLSISNPVTNFLYRYFFPFLLSGSPSFYMPLFYFSLSILSGLGANIFLEGKAGKKMLIFPMVFVLFLLFGTVLFSFGFNLLGEKAHTLIAFRGVFIPFAVAVATLIMIFDLKKLKYSQILILLTVIQTASLFYQFQKFNPFVPTGLVYPQAPILNFLKKNSGIDRFWGFGKAEIEANFATEYKLYSPEGYDPLYPKQYGEFIQSTTNGRIQTLFTDKTRSDAVIAPSSSQEFNLNQNRKKVLNLMGVKYFLDRVENASTEKTFPVDDYSLMYNNQGWKVYENKNVLPRIFLASSYEYFSTSSDFEKTFFNPNFNPHKTVLLEKKLPATLAKDENSKLVLNSYRPNKITVSTFTKGNKLLFLSDAYFPGWKAYIDNKETLIYRADYAFRAIVVPTGVHSIIFSYFPLSFSLGLKISILSIVILAIGLLLSKKVYNEN